MLRFLLCINYSNFSAKACKRRWKTLRRHYDCGLLTNKQLLDKLEFLKNIVNVVPASQLRRNSMSSQRTLSDIKENRNLIIVPIVESVDTNTNNLYSGREVYETYKKTKNTPETRMIEANDSNLGILRMESCSQNATELVNSLKVNEVTETNGQTNGILSVENEGYDSDLEIIEPYIETIEVD